MLTATTLCALALIASTKANLFDGEGAENFSLNDACEAAGLDNDAACRTQLVGEKLADASDEAKAEAKRNFLKAKADLDRARKGVEGPLRAAERQGTKALTNWCKFFVRQKLEAAKEDIDTEACEALCEGSVKAIDTNDAFECADQELAKKKKELVDNSDDERLVQVQQAQLANQAFFVATFEEDTQEIFDEVTFGRRAQEGVEQAAGAGAVSALIREANDLVNNSENEDNEDLADALEFAEEVLEVAFEDDNVVNFFEAVDTFDEAGLNKLELLESVEDRAAQGNGDEAQALVFTLFKLNKEDVDEDDQENVDEALGDLVVELATEIIAVPVSQLEEFTEDRKRQTTEEETDEETVDVLVGIVGTNSALERQAQQIQLSTFCLANGFACTFDFGNVGVNRVTVEEALEFTATSTEDDKDVTADEKWKPKVAKHNQPGHKAPKKGEAGYNGDESTEKDSDDEEDSASALALGMSALFAGLAMFL